MSRLLPRRFAALASCDHAETEQPGQPQRLQPIRMDTGINCDGSNELATERAPAGLPRNTEEDSRRYTTQKGWPLAAEAESSAMAVEDKRSWLWRCQNYKTPDQNLQDRIDRALAMPQVPPEYFESMMRAGSVPQPATGGMESSQSLDIHIGRWPLAAYHSTPPVRFDGRMNLIIRLSTSQARPRQSLAEKRFPRALRLDQMADEPSIQR